MSSKKYSPICTKPRGIATIVLHTQYSAIKIMSYDSEFGKMLFESG